MLLHACDVNLHSKIPVSVLIASQHREHHENQGIYEASRSQGYPGGEGGTEHYEFVHVCNRLYDFSTSQLAHMALSLQSSQKKTLSRVHCSDETEAGEKVKVSRPRCPFQPHFKESQPPRFLILSTCAESKHDHRHRFASVIRTSPLEGDFTIISSVISCRPRTKQHEINKNGRVARANAAGDQGYSPITQIFGTIFYEYFYNTVFWSWSTLKNLFHVILRELIGSDLRQLRSASAEPTNR